MVKSRRESLICALLAINFRLLASLAVTPLGHRPLCPRPITTARPFAAFHRWVCAAEPRPWTLDGQGGQSTRVLGAPFPNVDRRVNGAGSQRSLAPKPILDLAHVEAFLHEHGHKEIHARVLYKWLFQRQHKGAGASTVRRHHWTSESLPTDLSKDLRTALVKEFALSTSKVVERTDSESGGLKLLIQLQDGHLVETVVIRHEHESSERVRHTICVSSQVGCAKVCVHGLAPSLFGSTCHSHTRARPDTPAHTPSGMHILRHRDHGFQGRPQCGGDCRAAHARSARALPEGRRHSYGSPQCTRTLATASSRASLAGRSGRERTHTHAPVHADP